MNEYDRYYKVSYEEASILADALQFYMEGVSLPSQYELILSRLRRSSEVILFE